MADLTISLIIAFLAVSIIITFLIKRFIPGSSTFFVGSMIKTTRFLPLLDRFAKHSKFLNFLSEIGLVLGFGLFAVDYFYSSRLKKIYRLLFLAVSAILLYFFFQTVL